MKNTIGERLKAWRLQYGLAQHKVAAMIGVTQKTVCQTETGKSTPNQLTTTVIERIISKPPKKK